MARYVALLRGINVGGNNLITMADLKACFEDTGHGDVVTYIQSGNVVFTASEGGATVTAAVEKMLRSRFDYDASVAIRTRAQMRTVVARAPTGFGQDPKNYRYNVIFLMPPVTPATALRDIPTRDGVDRAAAGPGVVYFSNLMARASQSRLSKIASLPLYKRVTIRNWNTTVKLLALLEA